MNDHSFTYFSSILLAFNFKTIDCPSEFVFENLGIAPPGPKQFLIERTRLGWYKRELRVAEPRTAAERPEARSRTPAVGFANVPRIPLPMP
jgi:hypothetical protein